MMTICSDTLHLSDTIPTRGLVTDLDRITEFRFLSNYFHKATSSGTKVRKIVTLVPAEQGRKRVKLHHLNFDPYPCRTHTGSRVTSVATHATMRMS